MKNGYAILFFLFLFFLAGSVSAYSINIGLSNYGTVGGTTLYRGDLTGISGLTQLGSLTITDDGTTVGGADGIFSGFDLDAIFLDIDGDWSTSGDRYFASSYIFSAGTTRSTTSPSLLPNASHPGPTFGSLNATTIDYTTATLEALDAVSVADVNTADGFLTLGDGGILSANFNPAIPIGASLWLAVGEVGGQPGEFLGASVEVSTSQVPEPATILLIGTGLIGLAGARRKFKK